MRPGLFGTLALRRKAALSGFALVIAGTLATAPAPEGPSHYWYFKQRIDLTMDTGSVALHGAVASTNALESAGIRRGALRDWPVGGWRLGAISGTTRSEASTIAAVRRVETSGGAGFVSPVFLDSRGEPIFITRDILVGFREGVTEQEQRGLISRLSPGSNPAPLEELRAGWRVRTSHANGLDVLTLANAMAQLEEVVFAEPDVVFCGRGSVIPNDPTFTDCWGLLNTGQFGGIAGEDMRATTAWDSTIGDPSVIVAVLDTGVDQAHADISQIIPGIDVTTDAGDGGPVNSFDNHATPVAGCVSALINNSIGTVGIAPGCRVYSVRPFISVNSQGNWTSQSSWTVDALDAAQTAGARVTNNSNQYGFSSGAIATKYSQTRAAGLVHFSSAGNDNGGSVTYPANLPTVNAISSVDPDGTLSGFSNIGPEIVLTAPGQSIATTDRTGSPGWTSNDEVLANGTSFASPYAAGVAALALSLNPAMTPTQVEGILYATARDIGSPGPDNSFGFGFVDAASVVANVLPPGAFSLLSPADGATGLSLSPFFQWSQSSDADDYRLFVDDDMDFSSPEIDVVTTLTSFTAAGDPLTNANLYFWKVIASNALGDTGASGGARTFTTFGQAPGLFALVSPSGTTETTTDPPFQWSTSANAVDYLLEVDDDPAFTSPEISDTVAQPGGGATFVDHTPSPGQLLDATTYHWRATASNVLGQEVGLPGSLQFDILLTSECDGDVNGDGLVSVDDITSVIFNLGATGDPGTVPGDADGNGFVQVADISYVIFRLGTCP